MRYLMKNITLSEYLSPLIYHVIQKYISYYKISFIIFLNDLKSNPK